MISGIGLNAFQSSAAVGVGGAAPAENSKQDAATKEEPAGRVADPVVVKPANIGGSSAIAAQLEASRPEADKKADKQADEKAGQGAGETTGQKAGKTEDAAGLTEEERATLKALESRDREVKAHEAAHQAVGGQYAGSASFSYERGPNGRLYAVGGEVPIDIGAVPGNPDATIAKLRQVRRAALAPAEPSAQDRSVAVRAEAGVRQAQSDKRAQADAERAAAAEETASAREISAANEAGGGVAKDTSGTADIEFALTARTDQEA